MKKKLNLEDAGFENMFLEAFDAGKKFDENLLAELAPYSPNEPFPKFFVDQITVPFGYVTLIKVSGRYFLITTAGIELYSEDGARYYENNHPYQPVEVTPNMNASHWFDCKIKNARSLPVEYFRMSSTRYISRGAPADLIFPAPAKELAEFFGDDDSVTRIDVKK